MQEMWIWSLDQEDSLEKEMPTHSTITPRNSHGQRSLIGYSPWCHKRVGRDLAFKQQDPKVYHIDEVSEISPWFVITNVRKQDIRVLGFGLGIPVQV